MIRRLLSRLDTTDIVNIVFFAVLSVAMLPVTDVVPHWRMHLLLNAALIAAIIALAAVASQRSHLWRLVHGFYMMLCIPIAFKQVYWLVPAYHPVDYDAALIAIDHALFGVHPTQWMEQFAHPVLTELLQLAYASFYFLPLALTVDLYRKKRMEAFRLVFLTVVLGFYLSYLGYLAVPAIGPRFTLHEFAAKDTELPGLLFTEALRAYTNTGESIPPGTPEPETRVQRDVFPSGHTQITVLVMFLAFRYRARTRWVLGVVGALLIVATVYLRYHYVIDLVGGVVFAVFTYELMKRIDHGWRRMRRHLGTR